ncbi:MAG: NADH-quinone oxidoreductase subunit NuoF [Oscillospiraceae bacterium]|nr:NADH-quinone oxidoreductase subunit NuoF [Oscillospiraceae bacterium]
MSSEKNVQRVYVCAGTGCMSRKSMEVYENFLSEIEQAGLTEVEVIKTGCFGLCSMGPIVITQPDDCFYSNFDPDNVAEVVEEHIVSSRPVERLLFKEEGADSSVSLFDANFYKKQHRLALARCGLIAPEEISDYIAHDGFLALKKVLENMSRSEVVDVIKASGLRGRGGAGFPTGLKWEITMNASGDKKYVVCNADEGDPGAFMDRSILEGDPFSVIEAMAIAGYAIGSDEGFIYVRAEYPLAIHRLEIAIAQAKEAGYLGSNILGSDFSFDVSIRFGAGAFVCGEETALISSIEGLRGTPRLRPPFPAVKGLFESPTLINNVETLANVGGIINNGAEWFRETGTEGSPGTKVFALGGNVNNIGLVEVPMGITLREIVYDIGGGIPNGRSFKAAQTGGPSGGCIPLEHIDTPIDYESLKGIGSMMGSGGLIIMDDSKCMVGIAKFFMEFMVEESCGKCAPCRLGQVRMLEILERITNGSGTLKDLDELERLATVARELSFCALGQTAPNPLMTTMKYFRDEYIAHIVDKRCPAGECTALLTFTITDSCIGCTKCARSCPVSAISGNLKEKHTIDATKCIKCGACMADCPVKAIVQG